MTRWLTIMFVTAFCTHTLKCTSTRAGARVCVCIYIYIDTVPGYIGTRIL